MSGLLATLKAWGPLATVRRWRWNARHLGTRRTPSGLDVPVQSFADWVIYREIFEHGTYDEAIEETLAAVGPEATITIVDLGANVGYFILRVWELARLRGVAPRLRLIGVEGAPATQAELVRRMAGQPFPVAPQLHSGWIGERTGEARIETDRHHFATRGTATADGGIAVRCLDLEGILPGSGRIDLLKCDIEGAEDVFVRNYPALLARADRVCLETHSSAKRDFCLAALAQAGLREVSRRVEETDAHGSERAVHRLRRA